MSADGLHGGKAAKDALNGFPFNSAAGGQSMLNSYGVGGADLDSKLRSDVLVGEQGSSEETGLMAPSVELDQLQAPWDGTDHSSPAHHMFNESDPILGPSTLEPGFLEEEDEEAQGGDRGGEEGGTLEECLGLPPSSSPSHPSAEDPVEPLSSSYMLFKDIGVSEEPSADQTDLSASPPPPYVPPPPLSLSDITAHDPQDRLGTSDVTESLTNPVEEEEEGQEGGAGFEFDEKEVEDLQSQKQDQSLDGEEGEEGGPDPGLEVLNPGMELAQIDGMEPEQDGSMEVCAELQETFVHKEDHPQGMQPFLGKLDSCPRSIEEPGDGVDGMILDPTAAEENSLDSETLMGNTMGEFVQEAEACKEDGPDQVDEVSAGQLDQVSLMHVPLCDEVDVKPEAREQESFYSEYSEAALPPGPAASGSGETSRTGAGIKTEKNYKVPSEDCKSTLTLDEDTKEGLLDQKSLSDTKPVDLKLSLLPDSVREKKPEGLELPVKAETFEEVYPDSSEVKHELSYSVKSEDLETKSEQVDFPVTSETLEPKPEDLSLPLKPESEDRKPEVLQFAAFSEVKPEVKPVELGLGLGPGLKTETKVESLEFTAYPDSSEIKAEVKPDQLEFRPLPEIKSETKQELLEADSTVLTPKLEPVDGLMEVKGQVKEERPATPVPVSESYVGSPRFAAPISMCEIPDSLHDSREPTIAQLLQEKALYSFSEWPKDRVIINRLDSICHAILKGKWPSSSEQYDSPASLPANSCLANSLSQQHRAGFLPTTASSSIHGQPRVQQTGPGLGFSIPPPLTRLPKYMQRGGACGRGAWRLTSLPLLQERLVAPPFLPELKRAGGRRSFDYEAAAAAAAAKVLAGKPASSATTTSSASAVPVVAPPSHHTGAMLINGWQEAAIDLTKPSGENSTSSASGEAVVAPGGSHKLPPPPPINAPLTGSVGIDMAGILQAGLIHPVTGQIVNGSLRGDDSLRRRRGRRRNVEALYSEFTKNRGLHLPDSQGRVEVISHSSVSSSTSSPSPSPSERPAGPPTPSSSSTPTPTQTPPQPEIVAIDREAASKGLIEWLRQNPGYSMDLPAFAHSGAGLLHGFVERPKQRRHRCKDPTKLDINTLTGEERVPVVHRGTGRRLGGAMAPAIKELSRWLDANSEYFVAPDWADVVKTSGFLPEGKFSRILTEPVNRDPNSRRRGRRPRNEMPKPLLSVSDSASSGLAPPLFMNGGLIGSMDSMVAMQNIRGGIPGIPISGIMAAGFPHGFSAAVQAGGSTASTEDAKNGLSMLPMMLHGIPHPHGAAIPQHALFSVSAMMAHAPPPPPPHSNATSSSSSTSAAKVTTTTAPSTSEAVSPSSTTPAERESSASSSSAGGEKEQSREEKETTDRSKTVGGAEPAAIITSTSRGQFGSAHLGGSHLTFNPFLIPGMSHGLLYPHMFLPHGGIMALPAMPPGAVDSAPGSPKRRRKRGREDGEREEEREKAERESTVKASVSSSSPSLPSTSGLSLTEEAPAGPERSPEEPQEPDSNQHPEGVAAEETQGETGGVATEEGEQRQAEGEEV